MKRRRDRERIAIPVADTTRPVTPSEGLPEWRSPLEAAVEDIQSEARKRDPILDDVQRLFVTEEGQRLLAWLQQKTLGQQVRLLTTNSLNREAATDLALYREGQNSMVLALMNLIRAANEQPPLSRTDSIIF
jgi:hypothetical protein